MEINIGEIIKSTLAITFAKRKIKEGIELTQEEKEVILQQIYKEAKKNYFEAKKFLNTKTKFAFASVSLISKLAGEKMAGYHQASKTISINGKVYPDNYRRVLKGVDITASNQTQENFRTLLDQSEAAFEFEGAYMQFLQEFQAVNDSYKKDYESIFGEEYIETMKEKREEILELDTKYIKK